MKKSSQATKSSTAKSSDKKKIKDEVVKRTVGGLIFKSKTDKKVYGSVASWVRDGKPNDVYVYDHADTLKVCGFPICDGAYVRGMYRKMAVLKPKEADIRLIGSFIRDLRPAEVKTKEDGVRVAETKDHHKMIY